MGDRFPFTALPTGWFQVAYSHELEVGDIRCLKYFNGEQVLFRGADGGVRMLDAYCPHIGAHLAAVLLCAHRRPRVQPVLEAGILQ